MDVTRIDSAAMQEGAWMVVELPMALRGNGELVRIKLRSIESDTARPEFAEHQRRLAKARMLDGAASARQVTASEAELFARITVEWEGIENGGQSWPCTVENATKLYQGQPWLLRQVRNFAFADDPFLSMKET